jgi:hypothetical protein
MNFKKPYLNEEICFLEWLDEFSKRVVNYQSVRENFLYNISLLSLTRKERLYRETVNPNQYILLHAIWHETPQGHEYWRFIDSRWNAFLFNIEKFKGRPEYKVKKIFIDRSINNLKKIEIKFEGD